MCQAKKDGGKRCAVHHPSTLAMKFMAKNSTRLQEGQINFIFNALRHNHEGLEAPTAEEYQAFLSSQRDQIAEQYSGSEQTRTRLLTKLDKAISFDQIPDGKTFYALQHLNESAHNSWRNLALELRQISESQGLRPSTAFRNFSEQYNHQVTSRAQNDYSAQFDPKTTIALERLREATAVPQFEETPRITRVSSGLVTLPSYGYDSEDGRLEVEHSNGSVYVFHSVPTDLYERFKSAPTSVLREIAYNPEYAYENATEAKTDAYRVWCDACHEFKLASGHVCQNQNKSGTYVRHINIDEVYDRALRSRNHEPIRVTPVETPTWAQTPSATDFPEEDIEYKRGTHARGGTTNSKRIAPNPQKLREMLAEGKEVHVNLGRRIAKSGSDGAEFYEVTVPATFSYQNGNVQVKQELDFDNAKCTCEAYQVNGRCKHLYPRDDSNEFNSFVKKDVLKSAMNIRGYNQRNRLWRSRATSFVTQMDDGQLVIPADVLNDMRYKVMNTQGAAQFDVYLEDPQDSGLRRLNHVGELRVNDGNITGYSSDYGGPNQQFIDQARDSLRRELETSNYLASRVQINANQVLEGWEVTSETRTPYVERFSTKASNGYLSNPEKFLQDYKAIIADTSSFEFGTENVTNGQLSNVQGSGRGFGVEIEFVGGDSSRIARALHDEGLSHSSRIAGYHAHNEYDAWRVEEDCSVDGEIVSPILYDTPESWEQLKRVCEIAKEHGATADVSAGAHVHIGTAGLGMSQKLGVFAATTAHQDAIRRIATDPSRQSHRTLTHNSYTAPFSANDVESVYAYAGRSSRYMAYGDRYRMMNLNERGNTIEFRDPDSSLDPSHIQSQVMLASALVSAGESGRWSDLTAQTNHRQVVGFNAQRERLIDPDADEDSKIIAANISLMTTLDSLFADESSRKRMLRAALRNPWQTMNSRRGGY